MARLLIAIRGAFWGFIGKYEGDYEPTEDPQDVWNEENVDVDTRQLKDPNWRKGKDINQQLAAIVNNRQLAYRMLDCCANPLLAFLSFLPGVSCLLYAYAEHKTHMNNFFMAFMKSLVMTPFLGWMWMTYSVRTVLRELQEVPGAPASDCVAYSFCWLFQPFQLFMNAHYMPEEWIPKEFDEDGRNLQEHHDEEIVEKLHLD